MIQSDGEETKEQKIDAKSKDGDLFISGEEEEIQNLASNDKSEAEQEPPKKREAIIEKPDEPITVEADEDLSQELEKVEDEDPFGHLDSREDAEESKETSEEPVKSEDAPTTGAA